MPWPGASDTMQIAPSLGAPKIDVAELSELTDRLASAGVARVLTSALEPRMAQAFIASGFSSRASLVLLRRSLLEPIEPPRRETRRVPRRRWSELVTVDSAAFGQFWSLDEAAIERALHATPSRRLRAVTVGSFVAYAVSGHGGSVGYLQRLAVDPGHWGQGIGRALVLDALVRQQRSGVVEAVVNTEDDNERALHLYESVGFSREPDGLQVLERILA